MSEEPLLFEVRLENLPGPKGVAARTTLPREHLRMIGQALIQLCEDPTRTGVLLLLHPDGTVLCPPEGMAVRAVARECHLSNSTGISSCIADRARTHADRAQGGEVRHDYAIATWLTLLVSQFCITSVPLGDRALQSVASLQQRDIIFGPRGVLFGQLESYLVACAVRRGAGSPGDEVLDATEIRAE